MREFPPTIVEQVGQKNSSAVHHGPLQTRMVYLARCGSVKDASEDLFFVVLAAQTGVMDVEASLLFRRVCKISFCVS